MSLRTDWLVVSSRDPVRLAAFWQAALGWSRSIEDEGNASEVAIEASDFDEGGLRRLLFVQVPEAKDTKNRMHIDLRPDHQEKEVERLLSLGASRVDVGQGPDTTWVVLADPEGNEFCVLQAQPGTIS
jgi:predicted enzyme related to lactoylglutathione lyase